MIYLFVLGSNLVNPTWVWIFFKNDKFRASLAFIFSFSTVCTKIANFGWIRTVNLWSLKPTTVPQLLSWVYLLRLAQITPLKVQKIIQSLCTLFGMKGGQKVDELLTQLQKLSCLLFIFVFSAVKLIHNKASHTRTRRRRRRRRR